MSRRLSEELKDAVVADYLSGVTTREIIKKHKTTELYSILKERNIEYKQNNDKQKEKYKNVIELYNLGFKIDDIKSITGCGDVYKVLKKFGIERIRDPKNYNTNIKSERNKKLIDDYFSGKYTVEELCAIYTMSANNIYRILKVYNIQPIKNRTHHWVIHKKRKEEPLSKCKFYILENYYGYTKIGITTKNKVKDRYRKNINVFYEMQNTLEYCYSVESKLKKILKSHIPKEINKDIDGWSECYDLTAQEILSFINTI
jgi:hypothetical protein